MVTFHCYGSLIRGLYFSNTICPETAKERCSGKKKLVITFILASLVFSISYVPTLVFYRLVASSHDGYQMNDHFFYVVSDVVDFLFPCSLCFNPIMYVFRSKNFKDGFKRVMLCHNQTPETESGCTQHQFIYLYRVRPCNVKFETNIELKSHNYTFYFFLKV